MQAQSIDLDWRIADMIAECDVDKLNNFMNQILMSYSKCLFLSIFPLVV